jgi:hypothetical protein
MPASPSTIRAPAVPPRTASSRARTRPSFANLKVHPRNLAGDDRVALLEARLTGTNTGPFILGETDRLVLGTQAETLPATGRGLRHVGCKAYARGAVGVFGGELSF